MLQQPHERHSKWHDRVWGWFEKRAGSHEARVWLAALAFSEASFFIIAPDILFAAMVLTYPHRWIRLALLTLIASLLGVVVGYLTAAYFFDVVLMYTLWLRGLEEEVVKLAVVFDRNVFLVMFTAAFGPLPYAFFVLAGGFLKVNPLMFFLGALIGRGTRYILLGYLVRTFGLHVMSVVVKILNVVVIILILAMILFVLAYLGIISSDYIPI